MFEFEDIFDIFDSDDSTEVSSVHNLLTHYSYHRENVVIMQGRYNHKKKEFQPTAQVQAFFFNSTIDIGNTKSLTLYWANQNGQVSGTVIEESEIQKISKKPIPYNGGLAFWINGKNTDLFIIREKKSAIQKQSYLEAGKELVDVILGTEEKRSPVATIYSDLRSNQMYYGEMMIRGESLSGQVFLNETIRGMGVSQYKGNLLLAWLPSNMQVEGLYLQNRDIAQLNRDLLNGEIYQIFTKSGMVSVYKRR